MIWTAAFVHKTDRCLSLSSLVPADFIIRFAAMTLKAMLCLLSSCFVRSRKKGKAYMLLEYVCLLYRSVVPAPLWVRYLSTIYSDEEGSDQDNKTVAWIFAVVVTAVYLMVKVCMYSMCAWQEPYAVTTHSIYMHANVF